MPTREELETLWRIRSERRQLEQKSRALADRAKAIEARVAAWLKDSGRLSRRRQGFQLAIVPGPVRPKWRDAFLRELGEAAAAKVIAETPPSERLEISLI